MKIFDPKSKTTANEAPTNLLKSNLPIKNDIATVNEPKIGEKNLAAASSDCVGIFTPDTASLWCKGRTFSWYGP